MGLYLKVRKSQCLRIEHGFFSSFCFQSKDYVWPLNKVNTVFTFPFFQMYIQMCLHGLQNGLCRHFFLDQKVSFTVEQPWYSLVEPVLIDKTTGEQSEISYKRFLPSTMIALFAFAKRFEVFAFFFLVKSSTIWLFTVNLQFALCEGGLKL